MYFNMNSSSFIPIKFNRALLNACLNSRCAYQIKVSRFWNTLCHSFIARGFLSKHSDPLQTLSNTCVTLLVGDIGVKANTPEFVACKSKKTFKS